MFFLAPPFCLLTRIIAVVVCSRFFTWLIIAKKVLPESLFLNIKGFRLHHFVYGNLLIIASSILLLFSNQNNTKFIAALLFGVGVGLVLDELPLWLGDANQLQEKQLFLPYAIPTAGTVVGILALLLFLL